MAKPIKAIKLGKGLRLTPWPGSQAWYLEIRCNGSRRRFATTVAVADDPHPTLPSVKLPEGSAAVAAATALWKSQKGQNQPATNSDRLIIGTIMDAFEMDLRKRAHLKNRNSRYVAAIMADLVNHLQPRFKHINEISTTAWDDVLEELHEKDKLTWRTIHHITVSVRHMLKYAARPTKDDGREIPPLLPSIPKLNAPSPSEILEDQQDRRVMTEDEWKRFLPEVEKRDPAAARAYRLMWLTAMRPSEVWKVCLAWINWETGFLMLPPPRTKTQAPDQELYLLPEAQKALKEQLAFRGNIDPAAPIFGVLRLRDVFEEAIAAAKIDKLTASGVLAPAYFGRHSCTTRVGDTAQSMAELRAVGRWTTLAMLARYWHPNGKLSKGAFERLAQPTPDETKQSPEGTQ